MDDTFVLLPEPGSKQALGAITSLTRAMRNLDQVLSIFVRLSRQFFAVVWCASIRCEQRGMAWHPSPTTGFHAFTT